MARVPIACSLEAESADHQVEEWRQLLNRHVTAVERTATTARVRLQDRHDALLATADLARREKACCPFFQFRLDLRPEAVWLEIGVPEEAAPILDGMLDLRQ
ncbi:MAG TPA: hypothetical protein VKV06_04295 [Acidimicrobiales bacterium]|nr:hypothetical protein [Acidimicrobiales bacterium]